MLLQTNSYIVPEPQREAHARLLVEFRQTLARLGCDLFEVYEQLGTNWDAGDRSGRFVQIMRFRDREHQLSVQAAERADGEAQASIAEFCELINFPYQQEHGFFVVGFYQDALSGEVAGSGEAVSEAADPAYAERELDGIVGEFGAPHLRIASDESEPVSIGEHNESGQSEQANNGIGELLDATLYEDELDTPMEAELLDEEEEANLDSNPQEPHPAKNEHLSKQSRRK